jgi:ribosome-binding protein aMBF1 (putative translation factor)
MKMKTFEQFKKESMKRPGVRKAMQDADVEFQLIEAIIKKRIQKKFTQKALALEIGVTQSALARFESGRSNPTFSFIQKVTAGLGLRLMVK